MPNQAARIVFGRRLVLSCVATVLMAGGYLGLTLDPKNRLYMYFGWCDTAALLVLLGGAALAAAGALHALSRATRGRSDEWLSPGFFFLATMAGFNLFPTLRQKLVPYVPWLSGTAYYLLIWGLGGGLTLAACCRPRMRRLAAAGWRGMARGWALPLIVAVSLLTARKWEDTGGDPARLGTHSGGPGAPVVILILDMVGYDDAFNAQGEIREELPRLSDFSRSAMVFQHARSGGDVTVPSLPSLLLQEEVGGALLGKNGVRWPDQKDPSIPSRRAEEFPKALPYRFRAAGGRAVYIGYYLPYKDLMPGAWNEVFSPSFYGVVPAGGSSAWQASLWHQAVQYLTASKDPVAGLAKQFGLYIPMLDRYHRKITGDILAVAKRYIRQGLSAGDLLVVHLPIPHSPIVFDAAGGPSRYEREDPAGYPDQLRYADRLFGELVDEIMNAGHWEDSWVVALSDHGSHFQDWSADPPAKRHVPFMVKAPGQTERRTVTSPIRLVDFDQIPGFLLPSAGNAEPGK